LNTKVTPLVLDTDRTMMPLSLTLLMRRSMGITSGWAAATMFGRLYLGNDRCFNKGGGLYRGFAYRNAQSSQSYNPHKTRKTHSLPVLLYAVRCTSRQSTWV
jgi:hypothetical protein